MDDKLDSLVKELGIRSDLVDLYTDEFDETVMGNLAEFLSLPFINNGFKEVKTEKPSLYDAFVEEVFENRYSFSIRDDISFTEDYKGLESKLNERIRNNDERTSDSDRIVNYINNLLENYRSQLEKLGVGCILGGSAFYGDANPKSDADIQFYVNKETKESKALIEIIKKSIKKESLQVDVADTIVLNDVNTNLNQMINGEDTSLDVYKNGSTDIFGAANNIKILFGKDMYKNKNSDMLNGIKSNFEKAIDKDPILRYIVSKEVGISLYMREEKIKGNVPYS